MRCNVGLMRFRGFADFKDPSSKNVIEVAVVVCTHCESTDLVYVDEEANKLVMMPFDKEVHTSYIA